MEILSFTFILACILLSSLKVSIAVDSIGVSVSQSLSDGETLVSQGGKFELGFFSPGNPQKRYLRIWYKNIPIRTVFWVANRANPIYGFSGILTMNNTGNLVLRQNDSVICRTTSQKHAQNLVAELLDSGNLVVRNDAEVNPGAYLWQSFDYPADTYLPGMKIGRDLKNGLDWRLNDPSPGDLSWGSVLSDYPEYSMMHGTEKFSRIGPWNGLYFRGVPSLKSGSGVELSYVANKDEIFYMSSSKDDSVIFSVVINQTRRVFNRHVWVEKDQNWNIFESLPSDVCDSYGLCGANGYCITTQSQIYQCLDGFSPKSPQAWNSSNWAQGCVRSEPLSCNIGTRSDDGFLKYTGLKVPDTTHTRLNVNINLGECRLLCLNNCSCMAYTNSDIGKGSGCVMWFGDLIDIKKFPAGGQDLYIRMAASELELQHQDKKKLIVAITIAVICGMLLLCIYAIYKV